MAGDTLKRAWACKLQKKNDPSETLKSIGKTSLLGTCRKKNRPKILRLFKTSLEPWKNVVSGQLERYVEGGEATWTPTARPAIPAPHCYNQWKINGPAAVAW